MLKKLMELLKSRQLAIVAILIFLWCLIDFVPDQELDTAEFIGDVIVVLVEASDQVMEAVEELPVEDVEEGTGETQ